MYNQILEKKEELTNYDTLFVSDDILTDFTVVVYPVSVSQMISDKQAIKNIILLYPSRFVTPEVLDFVKSFMLVNDVLINIVISREEMRRLIETDPLTKLLNRSLWNSNLEIMKSECSPFFILFIDVDNFKTINDTHGHQKGDDILKATADWLKKSFRDVDKIFRLGGDEFAATGRINSEYLQGFEQKLNSLNESYTREILLKQGLNATISIGALICEKVQNIESLYSRVDDLLYESKEKGRNTISIISDFENDVIM
jgi:diguanylate cyclase (GGDEF)-like protein